MPNPTIGAAILVNATTTTGDQNVPVVAATANGQFVVGWYDGAIDDYRVQTFTGTGATFGDGDQFFVNANGTLEGGLELEAAGDGKLAFAFLDEGINGGDVKFGVTGPTELGYLPFALLADNVSVYTATQSGLETNLFVTETSPGFFEVGFTDGATGGTNVVDYNGNDRAGTSGGAHEVTELAGAGDHMIGRRVPTGELIFGNDFLTPTSFVVAAKGEMPKLDILADGAFVAAFQDGGNVCFRVFQADGSPPRTGIITIALGSGAAPDVVALDDGRFMVVWSYSVQPTETTREDRIVGHIYNPDGTSDSTDFIIDSASGSSFGIQLMALPRIDQMADGRVVVTYRTGAGFDIAARILDPRTQGVEVAGTAHADQYVGSAFADILSGGDGNDDLSGGGDADILAGGNGLDRLTGGTGNDNLAGGGGDDTLIGNAGADRHNGGAGTDTATFASSTAGVNANMTTTAGTAGDGAGDTFVAVENLTGSNHGDTLTADGGANFIDGLLGFDVIRGGGGNDFIFGRDGGGTLYGDAGNDRVDGGAQNDTIHGGIGDDELRVGAGGNYAYGEDNNDILRGANGIDRLYGGAGEDIITGDTVTDGTDILDGGAGVDTMTHSDGAAFFYVDNAGDVASDSGLNDGDRLLASVSYVLPAFSWIELFTTTNATLTTAINMTGNQLAQTIIGNAGNNVIDGKGGGDTMQGGLGDDIFFVDDTGDIVLEGANSGNDRVLSSVTYTLAAARPIERLTTTSIAATDAIQLFGNEFAQFIQGNDGQNTLDGKGGADTMQGYLGNDRYIVDNAGDQVIEAVGGGNSDNIATSVSYALAAACEVELFQATGAAAINLTGNDFGQTIQGNAGNNLLNGRGGVDTLQGFAGNDIFLFNTTPAAGNIDTIVGYVVADDTIRLENAIFAGIVGTGTLTGNQFRSNTTSLAEDADDRIIYETDTGRLIYDANGNLDGGRAPIATLAAGLAITASEFFII